MDKANFVALRDLEGKFIESTISYVPIAGHPDVLGFEKVKVNTSSGVELLRLDGEFDPRSGKIVFTFIVAGVGPICRYCVNGAIHGKVGRTHKHSLRTPEDPLRNLPFAVAREDLTELTVTEVWQKLCTEAKISHGGQFFDPDK